MVAASKEAELEKLINKKRRAYNLGAKMWSAAYHLTLYGSVVASAVAAGILQFESFPIKTGLSPADLSTVFVLLAAVLTAVAAAGNFERKWRTNRLSRSNMDRLKITLLDPDVDGREVRDRLQEIIQKHDEGIIGPE